MSCILCTRMNIPVSVYVCILVGPRGKRNLTQHSGVYLLIPCHGYELGSIFIDSKKLIPPLLCAISDYTSKFIIMAP